MIPLSQRSLQALPWLALLAGAASVLWLLSPILLPFALGAVLAYLSNPLVEALEKRKIPRTWGALLVIALQALILILLVLLIVPLVWREGSLLISRLPAILDLLQEKAVPWVNSSFGVSLQMDASIVRSWLTENWDSTSTVLRNLASKAGTGGAQALGWFVNLLLVPVVVFYLLAAWPVFINRIERLIPRPWHDSSMRVIREIDCVLGEFVRGQLAVMLALAVFYSIGLWIAGISFWAPVGIVTGLLVVIPYVGYGLGLVLALLVATLQFAGWPPIVGVLIVYGVGQLVESFLLTPFLVGERIGLHPLAAIFALMAFGQLFGFTGILVALPVCAALVVGLRELRSEYYASEFYQGRNDS